MKNKQKRTLIKLILVLMLLLGISIGLLPFTILIGLWYNIIVNLLICNILLIFSFCILLNAYYIDLKNLK